MERRPAWAEVELDAIAHNLREIRRVTQPKAKLMAVVKANGYGHGAVEVSKVALINGAEFLGVAIFAEAIQLREAGIDAPILILGYNPEECIDKTIELDVAQTVYSLKMATLIAAAAIKTGKKAKIHIKIDTGMTRLGFQPNSQALNDIVRISEMEGVVIEGIYTHFAVADIKDKAYTRQQLTQFLDFCRVLEQRNINIPIKHAANSAAIIDLPEAHLDMVRLGVAMYGLYPSEEVEKSKVLLKPACSLKARITHIKEVPANTSVSYGRKYTTPQKAVVATVPMGYADGYTRLLSSKGRVLVHGEFSPVLGTICMDQFMIDVSHIPDAAFGDEVVLLGRQGEKAITAEAIAEQIGTINYEIVCKISYRVPRVYI